MTVETDVKVSYTILEEMNGFIQNHDIFPDELVELGRIAIDKLEKHKVNDYETRKIVEGTKELLKLQLEINEENIKERDNLWKQHQAKFSPIGNHD